MLHFSNNDLIYRHDEKKFLRNGTRREKYSTVVQTHIVIVRQVRNTSFFPKL